MDDSVLNKITVFLWQMFCVNILLILSNAVLIGALLLIILHWITLPIYIIGLFLFLISLQTTVQTIKRLTQNSQDTLTKTYILTYKETLKNESLQMIIYLIAAGILTSGFIILQAIDLTQHFLQTTHILFSILLFAHFIYSLLIRIHFIIDKPSTWKLSVYCIFKYPLHSLAIFLGLVILLWLTREFPVLLILGIIPLAGFGLLRLTNKTFDKLKDTLITNEG